MTEEKNLLRRKYMMLSRDRAAKKKRRASNRQKLIDVWHKLRLKKGDLILSRMSFTSSVRLAAPFSEQMKYFSTPAAIAGKIYNLFAKECCQTDRRRDR
jgi:hypothetical protein